MMREFDEIWRDLDRQRRRQLQEIRTQTEITKNSLEIQKLRLEIQKLEREEQLAKEKAYQEWLRSPAGQAAIKREQDKRIYLSEKSKEFLFNRPYALIFKKNIGGLPANITYKNYISVIYWIFFISLGISMGGIAIIGAILTAMIFVIIFYFVRFELRLT
jgi:hypothetical protein